MRLAPHCIVLLLACLLCAAAQQPVPLHDGQQVTLRGALTMASAGRLQFVTVKTAEPYVPLFRGDDGTGVPGETLHEISLANFFDYRLLYAHRGEQVTVRGKLMTDEATPYFWHGTRLQATSIVTAAGTDLLGQPRGTWIPADLSLYHAGLTLPADLAAPWQYTVDGKTTSEPFLSCSSNGGGDVVNCFCGQGFHPTEVTSSLGNGPWQGHVLNDMQMAQFSVGDDARAAVLSVTCSR